MNVIFFYVGVMGSVISFAFLFVYILINKPLKVPLLALAVSFMLLSGFGKALLPPPAMGKISEKKALENFNKAEEAAEREVNQKIRKIAEGYRELRDEGALYFQELYIRQTEITERNYSDILSRAQEHANNYLSIIEDQRTDELRIVRGCLRLGLIEDYAEARESFLKVDKNYETRKGIIETGHDKIYDIIEVAYREQRNLTEDELDEIINIEDSMYEELLEQLGGYHHARPRQKGSE